MVEQIGDAPIVAYLPEKGGPWKAIGLAILAHVVVILIMVGIFQFFPIEVNPYMPPTAKEPPLEVSMVTESEPPPPPPDTPPDPEPPPPPTPPPPPPDLPPPPPAVPEMALPSPPPVEPLPEPVMPDAPITPQPITPVAKSMPKPERPKPSHPVAHAPAALPPPPSSIGEPEYLYNPRPVYPYTARMAHQSGTVLLLVTLDADGNPVSVKLERTSGYSALDHAALEKVPEWRFKPGPSPVVHVPVTFQLDQQ